MTKLIIDSEKYFKQIYERNIDTVYKICFIYLKGNKPNIEDAVQTTFLQMLKKEMIFENETHEKAWLITVASNTCKNMLKRKHNQNISLDEYQLDIASDENNDNKKVLEALFNLPDKYKQIIYMHYYEGYSGVEISKMLNIKENTIYSYLSKGRDLLKEELKEDLVWIKFINQ